MKKILLSAILLASYNTLSAQCTTAENGVYPDEVFTPNCENKDEKIIDWAFMSEYSVVQLREGVDYDFFNKSEGAVFGYVTITSEDGKTVLAHGSGRVPYKSDGNRKVRYYSHKNASCAFDSSTLISRNVKCKYDVRTDYCKPNMNCTDGAVIKKVSIADFINTSDCSQSGYNDFSSKTITLVKGTSYNLSVDIGYGWYQQSVSMWIDYNKNFLFDQNEFTYLGQQDDGAGTVTNSITIPSSVPDGEYRMRIRLATTPQANATWGKSCDVSDGSGETEDYTVKVVTTLATNDIKTSDIKVSPNPVIDYLNISSNNEISEITITNASGQVVRRFKEASKINMKSLSAGVYFVNIKQKDGQSLVKKIIKK